jgi:hypothetical protein
VHEVASGASISRLPDGRHHVLHANGDVEFIPACHVKSNQNNKRGQSGSGWQVFAFYNATNQATIFDGEWNVPGAPASSQGQLLYLFTGLVNTWSPPLAAPLSDDRLKAHLGLELVGVAEDIIQPVLQWGVGPAGGGAYWSIASWYVSDVAIHSQLTQTTTGHKIVGTMHKSSTNNWAIVTTDKDTSQSTSINVQKSNTYYEPWAFVTLEVYEVASCQAYPTDAVNFRNLVIKTPTKTETPRWLTTSYDQICNENVVIQTPAAVTINW